MATEKETVILDFKVDQGDAIQELERTKKVILDLKKEQDALNKAYKAGTITQEEYVSELVRVESILKKSQNTYSNVQKSVTGVKTSMDKLVDSTKNVANQVNVAGVNVGALGAKITALANPVTAAVAVVGALGAAYARSANGAKDLEFASNQLSAVFGLMGNDLAKLVGSGSGDGEGLLSKLLNLYLEINPLTGTLDRLGITNFAEDSKNIALAIERLQDLQREEIGIRSTISERLADNQEKLSKIQDSQTKYSEQVHLASEIIENITKNEDELVAVKQKQIAELEEQKKSAKDVEGIETKVLEIQRDISNVQRDAERKRQGIIRLESNLLDTYNKQAEALRKQRDETDKRIRAQDESDAREFAGREVSFSDDPTSKDFDVQEQFEKDQELINAELGLARTAEQEKQTLALQTNAVEQMIHDERVARFEAEAEMLRDGFNTIANLFSDGSEAKRVFALAGIGADTASAIASLTANSEANPANAFTFGGAGIAQYAAGIIRILSNIVAAKSFLGGEFAGGGDFVTSKPTMIMVGDNPGNRERVTVEPLSGRGRTTYNPNSGFARFAGGGSMTFDGNKELAVASVQQNLQLVNSFKKMPKPVVGVDEITRVMNRVAVKERISR